MKILTADQLFGLMNDLGKQAQPFVFLIDAFATKGIVEKKDSNTNHILYKTRYYTNFHDEGYTGSLNRWSIFPVPFQSYSDGFNQVMEHIQRGDSFLLNYTQPTFIDTNLTLTQLFRLSHARYKVHLKDEFTCFSPETFITISKEGIISSHPMKGTAGASDISAEYFLLNDSKEIAEHHTIVDLIRNDLSRVSNDVTVKRFRYTERIKTNKEDLIQVSSEINGKLSENWNSAVGDIFRELLPAGSVTGAPKRKTVEIIRKAEGYERGWYTGIFGIYDGKSVDSAVLIRYVEEKNRNLIFKSGGGITFQSDCMSEYNEMIKKVYVPIA